MNSIKEGDIVGRKSYLKDIFFIVDNIFEVDRNKKYAILKGLNIRIIADSPIEDLSIISKQEVLDSINIQNKIADNRIKNSKYRLEGILKRQKIYTGKILHLDGDRKYSEKSARYYSKMGLNSIVKNITESRQSKVIVPLLEKYNPDILVITGHDAMLKNGRNYNNIYNYRNSRAFHKYSKRSKKVG